MVDRFEELRTYVAIAEAGGVNAAAARIGIARSAVSRRLSDLEGRIGARLVERSTRRFELTDVGRALLDESRRILADLATLDSRFRGDPVKSGRVTLAIGSGLVGLVAPALTSFREKHGEVIVGVVGIDDAETDDVDIRVVATVDASARRVAVIERVVVCSPGYLEGRPTPCVPGDLAEHQGVAIRGTSEEWTFRRGASGRPDIAFEVADADSAIALIRSGAGLAQLPRHLCTADVERGTLVVVLAGHEPKAGAAVVETVGTSPLAAMLADHLAAKAG